MKKIVKMKQITHHFGKERIIDDVDLSISKGEIFGLLGPSGAGKTTLVKMMTGLLTPVEGEVKINSKPMPSLSQMENYGFMAQSDALYQELTARENLDCFSALYKYPRKKRRQRIAEVLDMVNLSSHAEKPVETFSGGMKRRLSLAAALIHQPELIILDEPTVGIDPVLRNSIWEELKRLKDNGVTVIVTTHVMGEAEKCDRLALLRNGKIIAMNTPQILKQERDAKSIEEVFLYYGGTET